MDLSAAVLINSLEDTNAVDETTNTEVSDCRPRILKSQELDLDIGALFTTSQLSVELAHSLFFKEKYNKDSKKLVDKAIDSFVADVEYQKEAIDSLVEDISISRAPNDTRFLNRYLLLNQVRINLVRYKINPQIAYVDGTTYHAPYIQTRTTNMSSMVNIFMCGKVKQDLKEDLFNKARIPNQRLE